MKKSGYQIILYRYLKEFHCGERNAIHSKDLERAFGIHRSTVQRCVRRLRMKGIPICSGQMGYYFARSKIDIVSTIVNIDETIETMTKAREGLAKAYDRFSELKCAKYHVRR